MQGQTDLNLETEQLTTETNDQLLFLLEILQSIHDVGCDADVIYTLLNQNLRLLNEEIIKVPKNLVDSNFAEADEYEKESLALDVGSFGVLIHCYPIGNVFVNLELAITCYEIFLATIIFNKSPEFWALAKYNLARAYSNRIKGDKADNIEKAITGYQAALSIYTLKAFPQNWAMVQDNLADAHSEKIVGEATDNLQQSLDYYQLALKVFTINSFPNQWVSIQLKLAKLSIEKMHNYQMAMEHLAAAYEHLSISNSDIGLLAQTMFDMARCFHQTGCLDQAKIYFKDAIRIYQRLEQPAEVAAATSALGNLELQMGLTQDAQEHLQTALEFYQAAGQTNHVASIQALQQHLPIKLREIAS